MGLFDLFKKKTSSTEVSIDRKEKDDDSRSKIGVGIALDQSVRESIANANQKYMRPDYNPQTRKLFYDDSIAHQKAMDNAFHSGKTVRDPYTGAELLKKQRDAKLQYGQDWQSHAAEADHIDPLSQFAKRTENNPFLTTDDIREIGNSQDNFQVLSRKLNQGSKSVGKGGSTQQEWADDSYRMQGLEENIETGESLNSVRDRIENIGKDAERRNDSRAMKRGVENAVETAHKAGKAGATHAGVTALTMSGIMNVVSVLNGEKTADEAIEDTINDSGNAAITGYAMGGGLTVVSQALSKHSSDFVRALAENNVPGKVITAVMVTGDTLKKWGDGEITTQECLIQLGDKGLNMATMGYSMTVGQALIPIPIVGGAVGALVGSILTSNFYNGLIDTLKTKQLEHEERMRIIAECNAAAEQARVFRAQLEEYLDSYFQEYRTCFNSALSSMSLAYEMGDADGVIAGANEITEKLGGEVKYRTINEFKSFLDSDEDDFL